MLWVVLEEFCFLIFEARTHWSHWCLKWTHYLYECWFTLRHKGHSDSCCPSFKPQQGRDDISPQPELTVMAILVLFYSPSSHSLHRFNSSWRVDCRCSQKLILFDPNTFRENFQRKIRQWIIKKWEKIYIFVCTNVLHLFNAWHIITNSFPTLTRDNKVNTNWWTWFSWFPHSEFYNVSPDICIYFVLFF